MDKIKEKKRKEKEKEILLRATLLNSPLKTLKGFEKKKQKKQKGIHVYSPSS